MTGLIAIPVTATRIEALLAYYLLAGIPWGIWQTRMLLSKFILRVQTTSTSYHLVRS